ncbi:MAG: hemin uptake protein HemP [Aliihoeflea sp.]|jgi:hemin uptake protein HemP
MSNAPDAFKDRSKTDWKPTDTYLELRRVKSSDLFAGQTEIGIDHGGSLYRLKITRQGKLILNK